ncbi:MAG: RNA 2',3'-cyclic phosphodiesterase [Pseudomonadota bacterium]
MRSFIALPLPGDTKADLLRVQSALPAGRPVSEDNLHLTLCFIPELPEHLGDEVDFILQSVRGGPIALRFSGWAQLSASELGLFAIAVDRTPELLELQSGLERRLRMIGVALPTRRFVPHVTLARPDRGGSPSGERLARFFEGHGPPSIAPADVSTVGWYQSTLGPDGARYDLLAEYAIRPR